MKRIVRSPQYSVDLESIWLEIAADSPASADKVVTAIERAVGLLADFPRLGTLCEQLAPGLRRIRWRDYLIYYRMAGEHIELARVLHGRRNITTDEFR